MIISIANQKGGVGKTTTTQSLAAGLVKRGFSVLSIDLDPQSDLSTALAADSESSSIYEVMNGSFDINDVIQKSNSGDIIPSNILLAASDIELFQKMKREEILKSSIKQLKQNYDFILIDTPPALGLLTINAFTASDRIIIPMGANKFSLQAIGQLSNTIKQVQLHCNSNLVIDGILLTMYNSRTVLGKDFKSIISDVATNKLNSKLYNTFIRASISIQEAQTSDENIFDYDPNSNALIDYDKFVTEFLEGIN